MTKGRIALIIFSAIIIIASLFIVNYTVIFTISNLAPLLIILACLGNIILIIMTRERK